jgi:hypothetical protein
LTFTAVEPSLKLRPLSTSSRYRQGSDYIELFLPADRVLFKCVKKL